MISRRGYWLGMEGEGHFFDEPLAFALLGVFVTGSVADFGCGAGAYVRYFRERGLADCEGYDGNPSTPVMAPGCQILDLSRPADLGRTFDWVLSLEVGEHVPPEHEAVFLDNLHRHNRRGLVVSWALEGQGGRGHVNERSNDYIKGRFADLGYANDLRREVALRSAASLWWFRQTVMVFVR